MGVEYAYATASMWKSDLKTICRVSSLQHIVSGDQTQIIGLNSKYPKHKLSRRPDIVIYFHI